MEFNPSSTNFSRVYLTSSGSDLGNALDGYFVMVGSSTDDIALYRQSGSTRTKIIDGTDDRLNSQLVAVRIKVTRSETGLWQLYSDRGLTGSYQLEGEAIDATHTVSHFFGVQCIYTATRSDKFAWDDVVVTGEAYPPAPPANWKDVIITEVMADPTPVVALPEAEFVELFNRTDRELDLAGWKVSDGSSAAALPSFNLQPGAYALLTADAQAFAGVSNVIEVPNLPSLNNTGDHIVITSTTGVVVDSIRYADTWYGSDEKRAGGWSLELIDPENLCGEEQNWIAADDPRGGTPGHVNSVFASRPDVTPPQLAAVLPVDATRLRLRFNEKLHTLLPAANQLSVVPGAQVHSIGFADVTLRVLEVTFQSPLSVKTLYSASIAGIRDCTGNASPAIAFRFALPEPALAGDVLINEILFNPHATGVDFVEVANASDKYIRMNNWSLANMEPGPANVVPIADIDLLLAPGEFACFTTNKNLLLSEYTLAPAGHIYQVAAMPSLPDDAGTLAVVTAEGSVTDAFAYSEDYHSPLLKDNTGVSLERISWTNATQNSDNWRSASAASGFATPGYTNSQARPDAPENEAVTVVPEVFAPMEATGEYAAIHYQFDQGGMVANVRIFDVQGRQVKEIASNELLGTEGFLRWDGDRDDGQKARVGCYMVWFEVFDPRGQVQTFRKRVAVGTHFN